LDSIIIKKINMNSEQSDDAKLPTASAAPKRPKAPPNLPNDVKCVLLQGYGSVKQMKAISIPRPIPSDGEVLVHVRSWFVLISHLFSPLKIL
jgi:hypothetical protein